MDNQILKKNKKAEPALITIILLIFLILTATALIWRVVFIFINHGKTEISYKNNCLRTKLEIVEVNNNFENNLILRRGTGNGKLTGARVFLDNQFLEDLEINLSQIEEKAFTIKNPLLRNNPGAIGKYIKIAKLVGQNFNSSNVCDLDGLSAEGGVRIIRT